MAANIHLHQPRVEHQLTEHDDNNNGEPTAPDGQIPPQSETIAAPSEQNGQSSGDGAGSDGGTHDPSSTPPPPPEESIPLPAQFRYGLGDTVIMGRPDYTRAYMERVQPSTGEPSVRETAFAPALRAENIPAPTNGIAAPAAKPIPMPKPGGTMSPTSASPPAPAATVSPATTNAPRIGGEAMAPPTPDTGVTADLPSNREPYLYPGLHTQPEQSPHYANAIAYGREHGYSGDEVMKLAVLMQANRDNDRGLAWLDLKPEVLRAAVNAVVRNADNSFDTSGVFGGQLGYPRINSQRIPADAQTAAHEYLGDGTPPYASAPPEGWVLIEETVVSSGSDGDSGTNSTRRYYIPRNEINVTDETAYLPLTFAGYMQVPRGYESELSVGADGGVHDLSALSFDPDYGLIMRTDNYRPYSADGNDWDRVMEIVVLGSISYGMGGAFGAILAPAGASSTAAVIGTGAAQGAFGSVVGNMLQGGDISFRGMVQSALSGGLIAGLGTLESYRGLQRIGLDSAGNVTSYALRALSITGTSTLRGAIQALTGGSFRTGFTQAMAQGLAGEITRFLNAEITAGLSRNAITPAEATALRELSRFTGSAIRAAANPNDPMAAFAQDYLQQLLGAAEAANNTNGDISKPVDAETQQQITWMREAIDAGYEDTAAEHFNNIVALRAAESPNASRVDIANQLMQQLGIKPDSLGFVVGADGRVTVVPDVRGTVFDDDGNLMPGVTDTAKPISNQAQQIEDRLLAQGISANDAHQIAQGWLMERIADTLQAFDGSMSRERAIELAAQELNNNPDAEGLTIEVITRVRRPNDYIIDDLFGAGVSDQLDGAATGVAQSFAGQIEGVFDLGRLSVNGYLNLINLIAGEDIFADAAAASVSASETTANILANIDQLPEQLANHIRGQLAEAERLEAAGRTSEAAQIRSRMAADMVLAVANPRSSAGAAGRAADAVQVARINRVVEGIGPQRFQQLTERYAEVVNSNRRWQWVDDVDATISRSQRDAVRQAAIDAGLVPHVPFIAGTKFPDFNAVPGLVRDARVLPRELWGVPEGRQYTYLNNLIGDAPPGYTWHHSQVPGRMELVPFGVHGMYGHQGGCSPGQWSFGSRR